MVFQMLSDCSDLKCSDLTLAQKAAAMSILSKLSLSLHAATRAQIKPFVSMARSLLSSLAATEFVLFYSLI